MKCNNCGNILLVGTTVCPYCNTPQNESNEPSVPVIGIEPANNAEQVSNPVPVIGVETVTEETPVMENQSVGEELANISIETANVEPTVEAANVSVEETPSVEVTSAPVEETVAMSEPTSEPVQSMPTQVVETNPVQPEVTPVQITQVETAPKVNNAVPAKKGKGSLIVIIILIILAGLVAAFYYVEYQTANARIGKLFTALKDETEEVKTDEIKKQSGKYAVKGSANIDGVAAKIDFNGNYSLDMDSKFLNYGISLNSLYLEKELLDVPFKAGVQVSDDKLYMNLESVYNKILSADFDTSDLFEITDVDSNYTVIGNGILDALESALKSMNKKQSIGKIELDGKSQFANIITIKLTKENNTIFIKKLRDEILNNNLFLEEIAKAVGMTVENVKEALNSEDFSDVDGDDSTTIKIVTPLIKNDLLGIVLESEEDKEKIELVSIEDGIKVVLKSDEIKADVSLTAKETDTKDVRSLVTTLKGNVDFNGTKASLDLNINFDQDVTANIDKMNVKDSISINNLSEDEKQEIMNGFDKYSSLKEIISSIMGELNPEIDYNDDYSYSYDYDDDDSFGNISIEW